MKIREATPLEDFRVYLEFDDGTAGVVDLSDLCGKGVFSAWSDKGLFEQVFVSPLGALEWPGEIDLCPDALFSRLTGKPSFQGLPPLSHA